MEKEDVVPGKCPCVENLATIHSFYSDIISNKIKKVDWLAIRFMEIILGFFLLPFSMFIPQNGVVFVCNRCSTARYKKNRDELIN
jgi:hypothetical protein